MFKLKSYLLLFIVIPSIPFIIIGKDKNRDINRHQESPVLNPANPASGFIDGQTEQLSQSTKLISNPVPTLLIPKQGRSNTTLETQALTRTIKSYEVPTPKKRKIRSKYVGVNPTQLSQNSSATGHEIRALQSTITAGGTVTNVNNTGGSLFIPADPHGAAGPNHVVNVFNVSIEFYQKNGTQDFSDDLQAFFSGLSPANFTFDPKVIYDQFEDRWVVVTLERVDSGSGAASDTSLVLVAVSDDSDPNGTWTVTEINTKIDIDTADMPPAVLLPHWLDYPGLGVDEEAVYITGNMFRFFDGSATSGDFGGNRVIIIDKGVIGGLYDGGMASASIFDYPALSGAFPLTHMPTQVYGNPGGTTGTWLTGYSGLSNGTEDFVQLVRIDDPLGTPTFTQNFVDLGDVDDTGGGGIPDAPQSGGATPIDSGDRRVIDAIWRDNAIYFTTQVLPAAGDDAGEATSFWGQISTTGTPAFLQGSTIGGDDDISPDTYTSYPSIAVNNDGGIVVGFSASSSSTFPSSYFVNRSPTDPPGTMRPATLIRAGEASYVRTFGSANRWGDYSATSVDPDEECFWVYNKYATTQGTPTSGEDGRYLTVHAQFCNDSPVANNDTATVDQGMTVTTVNGASTSLLNNDSDVDLPDDSLSMQTTAISGPNNGSVILNSNGTFSYTHDNSAATTDSFTYRICDDGSPSKCDDGIVNISVQFGFIFSDGFEN